MKRIAFIHIVTTLDRIPEIFTPRISHQISDDAGHEPGDFVYLTPDNGRTMERYVIITSKEETHMEEFGWYFLKLAYLPRPNLYAIKKGSLYVEGICNGFGLFGQDLTGRFRFIAHLGDNSDGELNNYDPNGDPELEEAYQFRTYEETDNEIS